MKKIDLGIVEQAYPSLETAECWAVIARGKLAFRFGPFTGAEAGKIMEESTARELDVTIIMNCGKPFDWEMAKDLKGWTEKEYRDDERRVIAEWLNSVGFHDAAQAIKPEPT